MRKQQENCTGQIEASTSPPPRVYPGHLTALTFPGVGNLIPMHKGGEFDPHA